MHDRQLPSAILLGSALALTMGGCEFLIGLDEGTDRLAASGASGSGGASSSSVSSTSSGASQGSGGAGGGGESDWSAIFGDSADQTVTGMAVDGQGNVIIAGTFKGTIKLGGKSLISAGDADYFLAKFDAAGTLVWAQRFGDAGYNGYFATVAVDKDGNVFLGGILDGALTFGQTTLKGTGADDAFVASFDQDGNPRWSKSFADTNGQYLYSLATDLQGDVIATGYFVGIINFGNSKLQAVGGQNVFLAKLSGKGGTELWSTKFGDAAGQGLGWDVAVDGSDSIILIGDFNGQINFMPSTLYDVKGHHFLARLDANGKTSWARELNVSHCNAISVDSAGHPIVTGDFGGTVDLGNGGMLSTAPGTVAGFVAAFDATGLHQWNRSFDDKDNMSSAHGYDLAVDSEDNVVVTGELVGTVDFGSGAVTGAGKPFDVFLAKFTASGSPVWSKRFGDVEVDPPPHIAVSPIGKAILLTGNTTGSVQFDKNILSSAGQSDVFLAKLPP